MLKAVTDLEMREIDRISIEETGIPASVLMNNAGKSVAEFILEKFKEKKITIFCGSGNNGGDGFTAAYYLANAGVIPVIYLSGAKNRISETSGIFMNLCEKMNIVINEIDENNIDLIALPDNGVVVDAILGTGFQGVPGGIPHSFIKAINRSGNTVVAVDIPSGLSSNGEGPVGECVRADYTLTIGLPKISLVTYPCREYCGGVLVKEIGFPAFLTSSEKLKVTLLDSTVFKTLNISDTDQDVHKGNRGHTILVGGFPGMEGAAILTASALFKTGCGLVTMATVSESRSIIAGKIPEAMTIELPEDPDSPAVMELFKTKKITSMIIGPGLGRTDYSEKLFRNIIRSLKNTDVKRVLIDGDGLFHLAEFIKNENLPDHVNYIITPHFMEASRILDKDIELIKNNRLLYCQELARVTGAVAVLKGPASIISDGDNTYINTSGNSGLATAGSGDVLSGITGALMNQDISALNAASAGVFIHGLCADEYGKKCPVSTMSAADIISNIRNVIK